MSLKTHNTALDFSKYVIFPGIYRILILLPLPSRQLASLVQTALKPWQQGILLRDDRHQEHEAQQDCQQEIQRIYVLQAQAGIQQVSSCLASPGADPLSNGRSGWVACGLQHLHSCLHRRWRQLAAVTLSQRHSRLLDHEEPFWADWEGQGCEKRFQLNNNGDTMHLSGDDVGVNPARLRAGRLAGIVPAGSLHAI